MDVVKSWEDLETKKEGIFVMPKERIEIMKTYVIDDASSSSSSSSVDDELHKTRAELEKMKSVAHDLHKEVQKKRQNLLP